MTDFSQEAEAGQFYRPERVRPERNRSEQRSPLAFFHGVMWALVFSSPLYILAGIWLWGHISK